MTMDIKAFAKKNEYTLTNKPLLRYFTFIVLYFCQGIPEGITRFAIPAWMAINGKSTTEIAAYSALIIVPFSLKILLAPMMERYNYLPMGRRRPWMLFGQFGIWISLIGLAMVPDPINNMVLVSTVVIVLHVFIMFQDIATDSLVIDIVPLEQQGKVNGLMWGSKTVGMSVSLAAFSTMVHVYNFATAVLTLSVTIFLVMFIPLFLRERSGEKLLPWTSGQTSPEAARWQMDNWSKLFKSFSKVVLLRNSILLIITVFIIMSGMTVIGTLLPIFTVQESGWTNIDYSNVYSGFNLAGGILGMLLGGWIIQKFGIIRMLQFVLLFQLLVSLFIGFQPEIWTDKTYISSLIATYCVCMTLVYIGVLALAMKLTWKRISAFQFTFSMTTFNFALSAGAAFLGFFRAMTSWQNIFFIVPVMLILGGILLQTMKPDKHLVEVDNLENNYLKTLEAEGSLMINT